jgi:hypothetical protein
LPSNRTIVDLYLEHPTLRILDLLLHSVRPFTGNIDSSLLQKIQGYVEREEAKMERNLESVRFEIDAPDTLALIVGEGHIERVS